MPAATEQPQSGLRERAAPRVASTIAGCFALGAFAVAIIAGLGSRNPAASVLTRALMALIFCYPIGLAVGLIAQRVVRGEIEAHQAAHPVPETPEELAGLVDDDGDGADADGGEEHMLDV